MHLADLVLFDKKRSRSSTSLTEMMMINSYNSSGNLLQGKTDNQQKHLTIDNGGSTPIAMTIRINNPNGVTKLVKNNGRIGSRKMETISTWKLS